VAADPERSSRQHHDVQQARGTKEHPVTCAASESDLLGGLSTDVLAGHEDSFRGILAMEEHFQALGVDPSVAHLGEHSSALAKINATGLGLPTELVCTQRQDVLEQRLRRLVQSRIKDGPSAEGAGQLASQIAQAHQDLADAKDEVVRTRAERLEEELKKAQVQIELGVLQSNGADGRSRHQANALMEEVEKTSRLAQLQLDKQVLEADVNWAREHTNLERMRDDFNVLCIINSREIDSTITSSFASKCENDRHVDDDDDGTEWPYPKRMLGSTKTHRQIVADVLDAANTSSDLALELLRESSAATSEVARSVLGAASVATLPSISAALVCGADDYPRQCGNVGLRVGLRYASEMDIEMRLWQMQMDAELQASSAYRKELEMLEGGLQHVAAKVGSEGDERPQQAAWAVAHRVVDEQMLDRVMWTQQMHDDDQQADRKQYLDRRTRNKQQACEDAWLAAELQSSSDVAKGAKRWADGHGPQPHPYPPSTSCPQSTRSPRPPARWGSYGRQ
jgi:hypothetical protein